MVWTCTACNILYQISHRLKDSWHHSVRKAYKDVVQNTVWRMMSVDVACSGVDPQDRCIENWVLVLADATNPIEWDIDSRLISKWIWMDMESSTQVNCSRYSISCPAWFPGHDSVIPPLPPSMVGVTHGTSRVETSLQFFLGFAGELGVSLQARKTDMRLLTDVLSVGWGTPAYKPVRDGRSQLLILLQGFSATSQGQNGAITTMLPLKPTSEGKMGHLHWDWPACLFDYSIFVARNVLCHMWSDTVDRAGNQQSPPAISIFPLENSGNQPFCDFLQQKAAIICMSTPGPKGQFHGCL